MSARLSLAGVVAVSLGVPIAALTLAMWPQSSVYGEVVSHGDRSHRLVALTFDDGPNAPATLEVASALEAAGVRGTFFLVGANVARDPETVRALVEAGHVVANHSFSHQKRRAIFDFDYADGRATQHAIHDAAGVCTTLFRAPNGFHTPWQLEAVDDLGMTAVAWDVQTYDWEDPSPDEIVSRVLDQLEPGSIVLMHDGSDTEQGVERSATIAAIPALVAAMQADGYEVVTVDELLGRPAYAWGC